MSRKEVVGLKLYQKFNLNNNVDFLDVELITDNKLWIDPMMIYMDKSEMGINCCRMIQEYFKSLLDFAIKNDDFNGKKYTNNFREINETRLGYSANEPNGLSGGKNLGYQIYEIIKKSNAVKTNLISDIFDASVMIEGLGIDKLSDFITNIILEQLIAYTQKECKKYNIPMQNVSLKYKMWSSSDNIWKNINSLQLPFDEESNLAIIFIPKKYVEKKLVFSHVSFYNKGMIPYLGEEAVKNRIYGLIRILKYKTIPHKGKIKKAYPCTRGNVNKFINDHPNVYYDFKTKYQKYKNYNNYKN